MGFDIDRYAATSVRLEWDDLDLDWFRAHPLPSDTLRTLRYMADVEYHTICYTRDLLTTPSHREPEVGAFMTMWNREEFWHGEALAAVLGVHGVTVDYDALRASRVKLGWRDRLDPIKQSIAGALVGADFIAVHMSWGAANEWSAITAYQRMADLEADPVLAELLRRIAKQEARHVAFYTTQARARLAASRRAQQVTRFALTRFWAPVGSSIQPRDEVRHVMTQLMSGDEGRRAARKVDESIAAMPGLAGLTIVQDALDGLGVA
ncbi:ferritin-like domain-containing protein [Agromyces intestinalis]|uniref:Ferritin-like domain-containing protein n=1 Tax=Agromyces intestinalis TaxID=2592652 RepID=A0A5C1YGZ2_9MICO|nr:ferritin-like domain-containing protein [Agromyces intestinalis]QEO15444.1 ferritin-like domain-containing protein [Agromyces intestinalis]